jgi:hypothetical protein
LTNHDILQVVVSFFQSSFSLWDDSRQKNTKKIGGNVPIRRLHWTVDFAHGVYFPFNPLMSMVFPLPDEISKKLRWMTIAKPFVKVIEPQDFHPGGTLKPCFT